MNTSDVIESYAVPTPEGTDPDSCWLVVINREEARIFHSLAHGTAPSEVRRQRTQAALRHSDRIAGFFRRPKAPAPHCFLEPLAAALKQADRLIVFGSGKGVASQMHQFVAWLRARYPALSRRIVRCLVVDEHHMTDAQMLARARASLSARRALVFDTL